jgi:hypothetical protein
MKAFVVLLCIGVWLCAASLTSAATLEWDRNTEPDMKDYQVWACFTANCIVIKSAANLQPGPVNQPAAGVNPSFVMDLTNKEGAVAVSARDQALNESGLSVPVPFDKRAPAVPANPTLR